MSVAWASKDAPEMVWVLMNPKTLPVASSRRRTTLMKRAGVTPSSPVCTITERPSISRKRLRFHTIGIAPPPPLTGMYQP